MPALSRTSVEKTLKQVVDPTLGIDLVSLGAVNSITVDGERVTVSLKLGYPAAGLQQALSEQVWQVLRDSAGVDAISVDVGWEVSTRRSDNGVEPIPGVKNVIAIASGKGGVGKSTTAVNLALALSAEGGRVGILDADIYGPSQPQMLGVNDQRPRVEDNQYMLPVEAHGLQTISMGYLVTEQTPMVWRGPMVSGALQQLLSQTRWAELDYLIVDMPPGTGDIQLTLSQKVPVSGAVIVTTPQDIALLDAKKGIEMFRKVKVPILGVVENMAIYHCANCGHEAHIFGTGGGERIARDYQTRLLGALSLDLSIREGTDGGNPPVVANPESAVSLTYREIARKMAAVLWHETNLGVQAPQIMVTDD